MQGNCSLELQGLALRVNLRCSLFCSHMFACAGYSHITGGYPGGQAQYVRVLWGKSSALPPHSPPQKT